MKHRIIKNLTILMVLVVTISTCCSCKKTDANTVNKDSPSTDMSTDTSNTVSTEEFRYTVDDVFYYIHKTDFATYKYKIYCGDTVFVEGNTYNNTPRITMYSTASRYVVEMQTGSGTNNFSFQYFDMFGKLSSETIFMTSRVYSVYCDDDVCYLAYFPYDYEADEQAMYIVDVFSGEIVKKIYSDFILSMIPANQLDFLNKDTVYVEYTSSTDDNTVRKIIRLDDESKSIVLE